MRGVVDEATVRYLPWIEKTAMVIVDLVDVGTGAPVEVSPRRMLQAQVDKAAAAGYVPTLEGNLVTQSESTVRALYFLVGVFPAIMFVTGVVLILFYNLDQEKLQRMAAERSSAIG